MTTNAFLFSWDIHGVEAIVPISEYEDWDTVNAFDTLAGQQTRANPLGSILHSIIMRARFNPQRFYEVYAVDCDPHMRETDWRYMWQRDPQHCANIIRERGIKLYGEPMPVDSIRVR